MTKALNYKTISKLAGVAMIALNAAACSSGGMTRLTEDQPAPQMSAAEPQGPRQQAILYDPTLPSRLGARQAGPTLMGYGAVGFNDVVYPDTCFYFAQFAYFDADRVQKTRPIVIGIERNPIHIAKCRITGTLIQGAFGGMHFDPYAPRPRGYGY